MLRGWKKIVSGLGLILKTCPVGSKLVLVTSSYGWGGGVFMQRFVGVGEAGFCGQGYR